MYSMELISSTVVELITPPSSATLLGRFLRSLLVQYGTDH